MESDRETGSVPTPGDGGAYDRPAPIFVGFREEQWGGPVDIYEFWTASGQYVFLHEMDCVDMQYRPFTRQLVLTFESASSELMPDCVAVLTFDEAEIYQWENVFDGTGQAATDAGFRGQVRGFYCSGDSPGSANLGISFHLGLPEVSVSFFASTVTCDVRERR